MSTKQSTQESFGRWLDDELAKRRMSRREFAEISKLRHGTINNLVNASVGPPRVKTIEKVANALRLPKQFVMEKAGLVPALDKENADMSFLQHVYDSINADRRRNMIRFAQFLINEQADADDEESAD